MTSPRERMVVSAALLIRERGARATAISDVLAHSGAPRGSAYHYFPDGRTQLFCEAIEYAGDHMARRIAKHSRSVDVLDALVSGYKQQLLDTDYRAGCPIVAVAVESGDPDSRDRTAPVIDRAAAAFAKWNDLIAQRLVAEGVTPGRATELAMLLTAATEGAIVIARAFRDLKPLDLVHAQLRSLLEAETTAG